MKAQIIRIEPIYGSAKYRFEDVEKWIPISWTKAGWKVVSACSGPEYIINPINEALRGYNESGEKN